MFAGLYTTVYRKIFVVKKFSWVLANHENLTHENFSTTKIYYGQHNASVYVVQLHLCRWLSSHSCNPLPVFLIQEVRDSRDLLANDNILANYCHGISDGYFAFFFSFSHWSSSSMTASHSSW